MKKQDTILTAVVLAVILGAAGLLHFVQKGRKLGNPGVKVVPAVVFTEKGKKIGTNEIFMPKPMPGWIAEEQFVQEMEYNFLPKDTTYGRQLYKRRLDGFQAIISAVLMGTDRTSIHKPQFCLTGQGWSILKTEVDTLRVASPHPYDLQVMKLTTAFEHGKEGETVTIHGIYVYWFVTDSQMTPHHGERMWSMAHNLITKGTLQRWAYITYFTNCYPGQEEATYEKLKEFIVATAPQIQTTTGPKLAGDLETPTGALGLSLNPLPAE